MTEIFQSEDPLPSRPNTAPFLAAQEERLRNKFDIHGNRITPDLTGIVVTEPDPVNFLKHLNAIPVNERNRKYVDHLKTLMDVIFKGFNEFRKNDDKHYDPLDDETFIGHESLAAMSHQEKEVTLRYLSDYLTFLERKSRGKHVKERTVGRHAAVQVVQMSPIQSPNNRGDNTQAI